MIRKNRRDRPFTTIDNEPLRRTDMSWEAKGLLAYLIGLPEDWRVSMEHLERNFPAGKEKLRRVFNELMGAGYIVREARRNPESGQVEGWDHVVDDVVGHQEGQPNRRENQQTGEPADGKPAPTKKETTKKDSTNPPTPQRGDGQAPVKARPAQAQRAQLDLFIADCLAHYREVSASHRNWVTPRPETKPTKRLRGQLKTLLEHYNRDRDEALAAFQRALEWAPSETWVQEAKRLTLENLASNDKLITWSMEDAATLLGVSDPKPNEWGQYLPIEGGWTPIQFMYAKGQDGQRFYCVLTKGSNEPFLIHESQWEPGVQE